MTENFKLKYFDLINKNIHILSDYEWDYKYIAMDDDGFAYAYTVKPYTHEHTWNMPSDNLLCHEQVELFDIEEFDETSWKDTLVKIEDVVKIKREQKGNNMKWEKEKGIYKLITKADNYNDMYGFYIVPDDYEKEKYNVLLSIKFQIIKMPYHKMELEEAKSYVKTFIEKIKTL